MCGGGRFVRPNIGRGDVCLFVPFLTFFCCKMHVSPGMFALFVCTGCFGCGWQPSASGRRPHNFGQNIQNGLSCVLCGVCV